MRSLTCMRGLPKSGKTTWIDQNIELGDGKSAVICRDELRLTLYGSPEPLDSVTEAALTRIEVRIAEAMLHYDVQVYVDDCNLTRKQIRRYAVVASAFKIPFYIVDVDTPWTLCADRAEEDSRFTAEQIQTLAELWPASGWERAADALIWVRKNQGFAIAAASQRNKMGSMFGPVAKGLAKQKDEFSEDDSQ